MNRNWIKTIGLSLIIISLFTAFQFKKAYAHHTDVLKVINSLETGDVNIELNVLEKDGKEEKPYTTKNYVVPGDLISHIPRITNLAEDCFIRCKIVFEQEGQELIENKLNESNLLNISSQWIKVGEYYYYKPILEAGKSIDLFEGIQIPVNWSNEQMFNQYIINITAEAVQGKNFAPDYSLADPWYGNDVELCIHESNGKVISTKKNKESLVIRFNGETHKLISIPDDFFVNFGKLMPGDLLTDSFTIHNQSEHPLKLLFRTETSEQLTEEQLNLMSKISLNIYQQQNKIYSGNLIAKNLNEGIVLDQYNPNDMDSITFSIEIPKDIKNSYSLQKANVIWIFEATECEEVPKTFDDFKIPFYFCLTVFTFIMGIILVIIKPKNKLKL